MGEVYRATDTNLKRQVAIKVLPASVAGDAERVTRFQREAEVLAVLNHPNIAHIHGLEKSDGAIALVMELVEGPTLADRIATGIMPIGEVLPIARQIADALEAAHEQGIIHRDLKPANIKVREDGTVKVLDFGLAKAMEPSGAMSASVSISPTITSPAMTQAGIILGTAAYMSPEQAVGKPVDKRTDLWSFGVVLLEMLTGSQVFHGETVSHVLASVLKDEPEWVALPTNTPTPIRRLLRRCLEKDRKRRLADADDARLEIEDALSGRVETTPPTRPPRAEAVAWGVAVLAMAAAGLALWQGARPAATVPVVASQFVIPAPEHLVYSSVPAISPDGRTIAFVATESDGRSRLWVRRLDVLAARALAGTDSASAPFWSPDSRTIGFFARGELKKVEIDGGAPQFVAAASGSPRNVSGSWSRDNVILFSAVSGGLGKVSAMGGDVSLVTPGASYPFFLPDGKHFLSSPSRGGPQSGIYLGTLDSPDLKFLVAAESAGVYADPGFLLFSRGDVLMAQPFDPVSLTITGNAVRVLDRAQVRFGGNRQVVSAMNGTLLYGWRSLADTRLEWVDRHGTPGPFVTEPGEYRNVVLSPDGSRVAFDRVADGGSSPDVWLLDLARHVTSRFTFGPSTNNVPVWSAESRTLAFASNSGSGLDIAQRPANMSGPPQILLKLNAPPIMYPSDWSSDGKFLAYYRSDPETKLDLWVLALGDEGKPTPLLHSKYNESQGQFSPDGKWIAYVSDESGSPQVYVQSFPTLTGKWQVSSAGGSQPRWRHDGKELFYLAPDRKLMAVSVKTGQTFDSDSPQVLFETMLPFEAQRQSYNISADGQRFLVNAPVEAESSPFTIVLNWTGLLKR
jgi:Tol biopolymer transport system component